VPVANVARATRYREEAPSVTTSLASIALTREADTPIASAISLVLTLAATRRSFSSSPVVMCQCCQTLVSAVNPYVQAIVKVPTFGASFWEWRSLTTHVGGMALGSGTTGNGSWATTSQR